MILTITPPAESRFDLGAAGTPHDYSPSLRASTAKLFTLNGSTLPALHIGTSRDMTNPHRGFGLPPPSVMSALTLPDPTRGPPTLPPPLSQLTPQNPQWHTAEQSSRDWLIARAEEDKRRQEEERTRQEELKLEQRKIEQCMLRDSIASGMPLHLVPLIFAGIGGTLGNAGVEMAQQYLAQLQQALPPPHMSTTATPDLHREQRLIGQPQPLTHQPPFSQAPPTAAGQSVPPQQAQLAGAYPSPAYASPGNASRTNLYGQPPTGAKNVQRSSLPRLTTNEAQPQPVPSAPVYQQGSHLANEPSPSPSISFHYWQPPHNQTAAPSGKDPTKTSPEMPSHLTSSDHSTNSPRKRKAHGGHHPIPAPSNAPHSSPAFSTISSTSAKSRRTGTGRPRSPASNRDYDPVGRANRNSRRPGSNRSDSKEPCSHRGSPLRHESPAPQSTLRIQGLRE